MFILRPMELARRQLGLFSRPRGDVKSHTRTTKGGKRVVVKQHIRKVKPKAAPSRDISYGPWEGDRESQTSDIHVNGVRVGHIEVLKEEGFQDNFSRRRTLRFDRVELVIMKSDESPEWLASDGWTRSKGIAAAKKAADRILSVDEE